MPMLHLPPPDALRSWLASLAGEPLSYQHKSGVDHPPESGFIPDTHLVKLGHGSAVYDCARRALRAWHMFPTWAGLFPPDQPQEPGRIAATVIQIMRLWWVNPCRILHRIEENSSTGSRCGFVYGTLPQHAECGEERFLVVMHPDGSVWYEIRAFSRPRHWLAWLGFPLARWWQLRFVRDSQAAMRDAANSAPSTPS